MPKRNSRRRHNLMAALHKREGGRCQKCKRPVGMAWYLMPLGWAKSWCEFWLLKPGETKIQIAAVRGKRLLCQSCSCRERNIQSER